MDKISLRNKVLEQRKNIPVEEQIIVIELLIEKLKKLDVFIQSKHIGIYYPIHHELNLLPLIETYPNKHFYLPNIENGKIKYRLDRKSVV